ncbi:hypothetical protein [Actinoplanes auranticolor]|uniref:Uncharacterized protein n=1 Tax=Actinoplanes auranticolor TaxID=47988 RepID=A0A919VW54_9ACTN|nr:hypothetical protein Aau02nite_78730 [Actinoplanes auranticolor]
MTEPGWPLIPREVLPAPVQPAHAPAAAKGRRRAVQTVPAGRQLSIFGVEAADPSLADLAGLLTGPGRLGRMGGTARVAVRVDAAWRVHVLVEELVSRGLVVTWAPVSDDGPDDHVAELTAEPLEMTLAAAEEHSDEPPDPAPAGPGEQAGEQPGEPAAAEAGSPATDQAADAGAGAVEQKVDAEPRTVFFEVRTAYSSRLNGLARAWPPAADRIFLTGPQLRLWVAAAGSPRPEGYALGLDPDGFLDKAADAALTRVGLAGTIQAGPAYVIAGRRRLARLAELVGERPAAAPERLWPGAAAG